MKLTEYIKSFEKEYNKLAIVISKDNSELNFKKFYESELERIPKELELIILINKNRFKSNGILNEEEFQSYVEKKLNTAELYKEFLIKRLKNNINNEIFIQEFDIKDNLDYKLFLELIKGYCTIDYLFFELWTYDDKCKFLGNQLLKPLRNKGITRKFIDFVYKEKVSSSQFIHLIQNLDRIYNGHNNELYFKPKIEKKIIDNRIDEEFNIATKHDDDIINSLKNKFNKERTLEINGKTVKTNFTDFQAFHICKGMKKYHPLYNKYIKNNYSNEDVIRAHQISMSTLNKYGVKMIYFVMSLPEKPFKCHNFKKLFSVLDKSKSDSMQSKIRFKVKNIQNKDEHIELYFKNEKNKQYINQIEIKNKTRNLIVAKVSRDGKVIPSSNISKNGINNNITPVLQFFYEITDKDESLKEAILSYGIETGYCSICGRELTALESKKIGVGPVCLQYI